MLTLSFSISYNNTSKKVTCGKSQSVNQLVQTALEKFKIGGQHGELFHNGKKLDSSLPIRLTNLVNNSKLVLNVSDESKEKIVNIKLAINAKNEIKSFILKTSNIRSLMEILEEFEKNNNCDIRGGGEFELNVLNSKISSGSEEMKSSLKSIIGSDVSSLVMRLAYLQANSNAEEQQKINEIQMQRMREYQRQEREKKEIEQRSREEAARHEVARQVLEQQHQQQSHEVPTTDNETSQVSESLNNLTKRELDRSEVAKSNASETATTDDISTPEGSDQASLGPIEQKDTLYIPSQFSTYENPDDDYEMTVDQAQKYHKMIINSSKKPAAPKPKSKPSKYSIRIKFPDRLMLQLEMSDPTVKLGQLLKKIDDYLVPEFQNNYNLKIGYPPFSKIPISLTHNNTPLEDSPFFQEEKIVLIWESLAPHVNGPYIVENDFASENIKRINELPEIKLETNRSNLPADPSSRSTVPSVPFSGNSQNSEKSSANTSKKVPKWFKPNK
mmetsp:Transcript_4181/g.4599  ORF Transcript_4181/g.4599 Transcript_4181/m.4599 type:complete len:500 (-) Transcript_4181:157-1656(-)